MVKTVHVAPARPHVPGRWRLIYFDAPTRGEQVRLLFALAGVEFDDVRLSPYPQGLDPYKKAALGDASPLCGTDQCPAVTAPDGSHCVETSDIMRFIGQRCGLAPKTDAADALAMKRCLLAQQILNRSFYSLLRPLIVSFIGRNHCILLRPFIGLLGGGAAATKAPIAFLRSQLPELEEELAQAGGPYFAGDSLTYDSVALFAALRETLELACFDRAAELAPYPKLTNFMDMLESMASGWFEKRTREYQGGYASTVEYLAVTNTPIPWKRVTIQKPEDSEGKA
jgi:glutathione S-transferase